GRLLLLVGAGLGRKLLKVVDVFTVRSDGQHQEQRKRSGHGSSELILTRLSSKYSLKPTRIPRQPVAVSRTRRVAGVRAFEEEVCASVVRCVDASVLVLDDDQPGLV